MSRKSLVVFVVALLAALTLYVAIDRADWRPWSKDARDTRSGMATEVLVMRTPGG